MFNKDFLVPTYYKNFHCKGMNCKNTCCRFWNITLTMKDYNHLANLDVSPELRKKIDTGVSIFPDANNDRYAKIDLNYNGECKLRLENGYCGLQCELGEENIPAVCRYYPRSPKLNPIPMCSISNSCEWVIEELIKDDSKVELEQQNLSFYFDSVDEFNNYPSNFLEIQQKSFDILSKRDLPLESRFDMLRDYLNVSKISEEAVKSLLIEMKHIYKHSYSIGTYLENEFSFIDNPIKEIEKKYSNFSIELEKILINHMFYMRFPYADMSLDMSYSYYGTYFVYRFLLYILSNNDVLDPVEFISNFFRVAEHANMYDIINEILKRTI